MSRANMGKAVMYCSFQMMLVMTIWRYFSTKHLPMRE